MAGLLALASPVLSIGSAIGSLFRKKRRNPTVEDNILAQARAARQASDQYGFNPLTMLQYGNPVGTGLAASGGPPPLSSVDILTDGLRGLDDVVSGDADRRRKAQQLEIDIAELKVREARTALANPAAFGRSAIPVLHAAGEPVVSRPRFETARAAYADADKSPRSAEGDPVDHPAPDSAVPETRVGIGHGLFADGTYWEPPPGWSPGQVAEDELGDGFGSSVYNAHYNFAYLNHNLRRFYPVWRTWDDFRRSGGVLRAVTWPGRTLARGLAGSREGLGVVQDRLAPFAREITGPVPSSGSKLGVTRHLRIGR